MGTETLMRDIAFALETNNMRHFLNKKTKEVITLPQDEMYYDGDYEEELDDLFYSDDTIEIDPYDSSQAFELMEEFVESISDLKLKSKLFDALSRGKPFATFRFVLDYEQENLQE